MPSAFKRAYRLNPADLAALAQRSVCGKPLNFILGADGLNTVSGPPKSEPRP